MENVTTARLFIRRLRETDLRDFLAYQTHPENLKYIPHEADTEDTATRFLLQQATATIGDGGGYFARAVVLPETGRMIGEVGLGFKPRPAGQPDEQRQADLGWGLHPDYHGHGYATEAAHALLSWAFADLRLHRVTAGCDADNAASYRLMERLGMRREGHFRESGFVKGSWRDSYQYALLRTEWLTQTGSR